jgi:hypothetical protein
MIIDTGTTGVLVPSHVYGSFREHLEANYCHVPHVCAEEEGDRTIFDDYCYTDPDGLFASLPPLRLVVSEGDDSAALVLTARQYMQSVLEDDGMTAYCLRISDGDEFLIGEVLLNKYYLEFDRAKRRLGFAASVADCARAIQ